MVETVAKLDKAFAEFRFDGMADAIYHFVWDQFCDWYLELIKANVRRWRTKGRGRLGARPDPGHAAPVHALCDRRVVARAGRPRNYDLIIAKWPEPKADVDASAKAEVELADRLVSEVRTAKNELGIAPGAQAGRLCP